ncbi:hypothetical protein Poli38472_013130 [Pythium oligandrum]|uniref:Uncharacterized protein n=1 Tax=Pythium oligandrum TaxID=41045 RepID=A0A8K1C2F4_PYTOL|nr:hypothetical protein Poli38472_013130 [Pythium oligandrum]|eukprot:TMW55239.1 hypothetical protein Poli38472_013130 [Pythium oligandrum]
MWPSDRNVMDNVSIINAVERVPANLVQGLRSQVDQLEAQYAELLHQVRLQEACAFVAESEDESESSELPENDSLKSLYADLMDVKEMLRLENEALKGSLALYQKYERQVRQLLPSADANASSESSEQSDDSSAPLRAPRDLLIIIPSFQKPVTLAFCHQLGEQTFADVTRFRQNPDFMTTGASIFGWRDRSIMQNGSLHFLLKKTFRHITADEFATRGWDFASKPKNMARICSASLNPRVFEVQRVDENNRVLLRVFSSHGGYAQMKFLFLLSFIKTPRGHMIIMRAMNHKLLNPYDNPPGVMEKWVDNYYGWMTFEQVRGEDEHCEMNYGGVMPVTSGARSTAMMMETLFMTLRSESHIIGLNLVTSS